jgi:CO/xanthine dehydrogenase FAD-binding subunit
MIPVFTPHSLPELWTALAEAPGAMAYAGGTDLLVKRRAGLLDPPALIHLARIPELHGVVEQADELRLGAACTHRELLDNDLVQAHLPVLVQALRELGSPLIRNMGTLGGNVCTASPAGDTLPPLYVLDAEVEICAQSGTRRLPVRQFITGPSQTLLQPGEIVAAVWVRRPEGWTVQHFEKVGLRNALACSLVSLAALLRINVEGGIERAALAWGSVGPTVMVCPEVERRLIGEKLALPVLREAAALARIAVSPIGDIRADADYRRTVAGNLLLRLAGTSSVTGDRPSWIY